MTIKSFVETYFPFARASQDKTGVPALFALAQSALESGWGKKAPGNMLFGMKTGEGKNFGGWQGHKQLITTTEYGDTPNMKFPEILPGYPKKEGSKWKYVVKDYFRSYLSPLNTFMDWAGMLSNASRYRIAMQNKNDPYKFAEEVAKAGYATDPNYIGKIKKIMEQLAPYFEGLEKHSKTWNIVVIILITIGLAFLVYGITRIIIKKSKTKNTAKT
jgi:flagellum-specific peptidoglycan hydrolase FlgJ